MPNIGQIFQSCQPAAISAGEMHHQVADGTARVGVVRKELFVGDLADRVPDAARYIQVYSIKVLTSSSSMVYSYFMSNDLSKNSITRFVYSCELCKNAAPCSPLGSSHNSFGSLAC